MKKETFAETSNQKTPSTTKANNPEQDEAYYVNIDGEDIKVGVQVKMGAKIAVTVYYTMP